MQSFVLDSAPGGQHRNAGVPGVQGLLGEDEEVDRRCLFLVKRLHQKNLAASSFTASRGF